MLIINKLLATIEEFFKGIEISVEKVRLEQTQDFFQGDLTFTLFDIGKKNNVKLEIIGNNLGEYLMRTKIIRSYNLIKGFLNMTLNDSDIIDSFYGIYKDKNYFNFPQKNKTIIVEYSSPNTNKPLHLGHLRNNFLGYAVCAILKETGYNVKAVTLVNDRGIHICKSMIAYIKSGQKETPKKCNIKGDHFVGKFYVEFDKILKQQQLDLNIEEDKDTPLMIEAQELLKKWEQNDQKVIDLWEQMNSWVLEGFEETYEKIGIKFDKTYFESKTYLLGKDIVKEGLQKNIFYKKNDGSVWIDLKDINLDEKLLLRSDNTSVYITQDLGTAELRYEEFHPDKMIYVVGDEQEYHFAVLKNILKKFKRPYADTFYHLSYGMIDLPSGKMKSREGTVVDADDLIDEMILKAKEKTEEIGKLKDLGETEKNELYERIGLAALKFYLLKINPQKRLTFDPNKSIDFHGDTGTFILYTYVRICSILKKNEDSVEYNLRTNDFALTDIEKKIVICIDKYKDKISEAAEKLDPSIVAQYILTLSKMYNKFYDSCQIINETNNDKKIFRLMLSNTILTILEKILDILGIKQIEKM